MGWKAVRVVGYSSPNKVVVLHDDTPIIACNGFKRASELLAYADGYPVEIQDKRAKMAIDKAREGKV